MHNDSTTPLRPSDCSRSGGGNRERSNQTQQQASAVSDIVQSQPSSSALAPPPDPLSEGVSVAVNDTIQKQQSLPVNSIVGSLRDGPRTTAYAQPQRLQSTEEDEGRHDGFVRGRVKHNDAGDLAKRQLAGSPSGSPHASNVTNGDFAELRETSTSLEKDTYSPAQSPHGGDADTHTIHTDPSTTTLPHPEHTAPALNMEEHGYNNPWLAFGDHPKEHQAQGPPEYADALPAAWSSVSAVAAASPSPSAQLSPSTCELLRWSEAAPYWGSTVQTCAVYSMDRSRVYSIRINPRVERGFFVADGDWTCYRRNYFQLSVGFSALDPLGARLELPCLIAIDNQLHVVTAFCLGITARTSNGQRPIDLTQCTPKRDKGPQLTPQPRYCQPQDSPAAYGRGHLDTIHTVTFDRLQFKAATANNGKRRSAQQYHVLVAELYAEHEDRSRTRIATIESAPLVVRGRAPGHYASMHNKTGAGGHVGASSQEATPAITPDVQVPHLTYGECKPKEEEDSLEHGREATSEDGGSSVTASHMHLGAVLNPDPAYLSRHDASPVQHHSSPSSQYHLPQPIESSHISQIVNDYTSHPHHSTHPSPILNNGERQYEHAHPQPSLYNHPSPQLTRAQHHPPTPHQQTTYYHSQHISHPELPASPAQSHAYAYHSSPQQQYHHGVSAPMSHAAMHSPQQAYAPGEHGVNREEGQGQGQGHYQVVGAYREEQGEQDHR
ncbi:uncharacterized protein EV422DRAFT_569802 [Fimicolochytrium jonesii]|uniref:uncharacterized protein n=1 Tax=Fimicolochytrium jonesii TaxID=1396493 RepID=UPI0022FF3F42|nr:uncharacterized protein EV422DRAFT_569802 [Fimicolochytrium jonesii]KAI8818379.1 hypothetical protein EV422DRAFT_569802 [Fimicolochytrium jonesii]